MVQRLYVGYASDRNSSYVHRQLMYWKRSSFILILVSLKCGTLFVNVWAYYLIPFWTFYCHELMMVNIKQYGRVPKFWKNNISRLGLCSTSYVLLCQYVMECLLVYVSCSSNYLEDTGIFMSNLASKISLTLITFWLHLSSSHATTIHQFFPRDSIEYEVSTTWRKLWNMPENILSNS